MDGFFRVTARLRASLQGVCFIDFGFIAIGWKEVFLGGGSWSFMIREQRLSSPRTRYFRTSCPLACSKPALAFLLEGAHCSKPHDSPSLRLYAD
jgi:hypothetical protein